MKHNSNVMVCSIWLLWTPYLYLGPFVRYSTSKFLGFDLDLWPKQVIWGQINLYHSKAHIWLPIWLLFDNISPSSFPAMFGISGCTSTVICRWRLTSLISPARAFITFVSYVSCAGVSPRTRICYRLQSILRAAARLVLQLPGWASVSNLMSVQLFWLSIPQRIQIKLC